MQIINTEESRKFIEGVAACLKADKMVKVTGLGLFKIKDVAQRNGRNPRTGETIVIPAGKKVAFTFAVPFKKSVL